MWKAADGEVFESKADADAYDHELELKSALYAVAEKIIFHNITGGDLAEGLFDHADELRRILCNK
jgi:dsDNA-binding SOS-regulon protein